METHQLELWFLSFFRSAMAMSERRIAPGVRSTPSIRSVERFVALPALRGSQFAIA